MRASKASRTLYSFRLRPSSIVRSIGDSTNPFMSRKADNGSLSDLDRMDLSVMAKHFGPKVVPQGYESCKSPE